MTNHSEYRTFQHKPHAGLIPRGLVGTEYSNGRIEWRVSNGDLLQAHKHALQCARYAREYWQSPSEAARHLKDASTVRRYLFPRKRLKTLDLLRGKA